MENKDEPEAGPSTKDEDDNKNFTVSLKHKKCCFINKVREQISTAERKFGCTGCAGEYRWGGCWKHGYCIIVILVVLVMAWICIIYGTVIGAALCSKMNSGSFIPMFRIPGLQWSKNDARVWKVF